jgi:basic membrane lipoprotein Med (substrate-binding protein (PBP1-ABC) superfamily)/DNA-binding SARP family transcriptional activator
VADGDVVVPPDGGSYAGRVRFEVLGRLRVIDRSDSGGDDSAGLHLGGTRQQLVLAMLLAAPNSVISTDVLVDRLWEDSPPSAARHTLQGYVSELRKLLGPVIEREGTGYVVRVDSSSLDSLEFEELITKGRAELANDPQEAAAKLGQGLRLWRGSPFAGFDDSGVLLAERTRLEEMKLLATEDRVGAELLLGRHREIAAELDSLSHEFPYREGLRAQHMLALYRSGRQAEALRAFQRTRAVLVDELGIEPSPMLRQLEEQILLQDPALDLASTGDEESADPSGPVSNPYKGLQAFTEADADRFYGRDELIEMLVHIVAGNSGLTAVVGPSGSGKSSLVQAGLIPALRQAERPDASWVIAVMRPGAYPFTELEAALVRAVENPPATSMNLLWDDDSALLRAVLRIVPDDGSRLLLVIDQFEELFALVPDEQRDRFLRCLITLATDPRSRSRVLVTLRADFYDRPLMHPEFGRLLTGHVVNVVPLAADELEAAAIGPALRVGITFELGLLAALIADVSGQPNALPLFQYTLTELFDRRQDSVLTRAAYEALGGIRGAVASRAEEIYQGLDREQQEAVRQLFLRLVSVGRDSETRRVVAASELILLDVDTVTMHAAVEAFVSNRLLVRDRDAVSGALTVEVAHEALLSEWERLRQWIDDGRDELRQHAAYTLALDDWLTAWRDPDYLLVGGRLDHFEQWRATTTMRLTAPEREFLDESLQRRDQAQVAETARAAEQTRLRHRARRRAFALGATVAAIATASIVAIVTAGGTGNASRIAMVSAADSPDQPFDSYEQGFVRAERDFDVIIDRRVFPDSPDGVITELAAAGEVDLVILDPVASTRTAGVIFDPDTHYVLTGYGGGALDGLSNVTRLYWADEQGGFLAGVAAATTTRTGFVGFLGAVNTWGQDSARAGFEAGAKSIDPDVEVLSAYMSDYELGRSQTGVDRAGYVANLLYGAGADVIFHNVGRSGAGVLQAAASDVTTSFRWVIGADTDQWQSASTQERPHVLTSIIKDFDKQSYALIEAFLADGLEAGPRRLTVADDMITYATNGDALSADARSNLDRTIHQLASGAIQAPRTPTSEITDREFLEPGVGSVGVANVPIAFTVPAGWANWNGGVFKGPMRHWGPSATWEPDSGDPLFGVTFETIDNLYVDNCQYVLLDPPVGPTVEELVAALASMPGLNATAAIGITVDGFSGKQVELTIPDYTQDEDCDGKRFTLWGDVGGVLGYWAAGPNEHLILQIVDVDGTRLAITASYPPDASPQDRADLTTILDSIRLG